ncbi:hypothetical protein GOQ29_04550 [Clostridium sp. D2Q-14]|uniref:hypothetical protein n=1 Tax=Anaeromonas gelatinilytica TaxID=2683194 RepID=UPI00193B1494|nr:hypothetical protein [Anaeromonas gelatinilytica]MBS4534884.1 hypothetical protein [Anaeromonas gelatinilytica]
MKHVTIVQDSKDNSLLKEKVNSWIEKNKKNILNIINIEYTNTNYMYVATITYEEKNK